MKKIMIIGCPGSGKTTFAKKLQEKLNIPLFHLDAIWHKPDKTHIAREEFDERLGEILSLDRFILDGNYSRTIERRLLSCDTVFLFDLDVKDCLEGAIFRLGIERSDMPWREEELDPQFKREIEGFKDHNLPAIYHLLDRYHEGRKIVVFHTRKEADAFLEKDHDLIQNLY